MRLLSRYFLIALAGGLALPVQSLAQDGEAVWEEFDRWMVVVNESFGYGCSLDSVGIEPHMSTGFDNTDNTMYVALSGAQWQSIEDGKNYDLQFSFDDSEYYEDTFVGLDDGATRKALVLWGTAERGSAGYSWLSDLASYHRLKITYQNNVVGSISLQGTAAAVRSLIECHSATKDMNEPNTGDPFEDSQPNIGDPFAQDASR